MMTAQNGDGIDRPGRLDRQFHTEKFDVPARVEVHKSHGEMIGFVFHVGEFSLPILRARPYRRICARVEGNPLRPWVMGRVTYKKKILLENPGKPSIDLDGVPNSPSDADEGDPLAAVIWIDGERVDFDALSPGKDRSYLYREIEVTAVPVLEQTFRTDLLQVTREIALTADGPVQRMAVEGGKGDQVELSFGFTSMFPRGVTEVYVLEHHAELWTKKLEYPSEGCGSTELFIPRARWLAAYDPDARFGTSIYSPEFEEEEMGHLLVVDPRQYSKVYHLAGSSRYLAEGPDGLGSTRPRVLPPRQFTLFVRPIEAAPGGIS